MSHIEKPGRAAGGVARAKKLSPERRSEIAREAARAKKEIANLPVAEYVGELTLGEMSFPCAVLSDGSRVLTETNFMEGMGMYRSGALSVRRETSETGARVPLYLAFKNLKPFVIKHLGDVHENQIRYKNLGGQVSSGIPANLIPKICSVWLDARKAGVLGVRQSQVADKAELLLRGLAEVGIVALVDEATGFQRDREKDALAKILESFVANELQPYIKTFPADYYEHLFRLRGLPYPPKGNPNFRPQYFGKLTNDIVYKRLAPGVLEEIKRQAAKDARKTHLHRRLTQDVGHPKLREHLASVVTIMKLSADYADFIGKLNKIHQRYGDTLPLELEASDQ